ncbi:MAG: hypothetical protein IT385_19080 [Deltaproteobacteria bacterium]|nr:hypothetical protein [Deltaproteobacteria bacterium]
MTSASMWGGVVIVGLAAIGSGCSDDETIAEGECASGWLRIADRGWDAAGAWSEALPAHDARDAYAVGRARRAGPDGERDYLVAAVVRREATGDVWRLKVIEERGAPHSGTLTADETLCLAELSSGVRWLDLGREREATFGPFTLMPVVRAGHTIDLVGSLFDDHLLLMADAGKARVRAGAGDDIVVDESREGAHLVGGDGADTLLGNALGAPTVLEGGPGDDRLSGRRVGNIYRGGDGDDCIVSRRTANPDATASFIDGGRGDDQANFPNDGARVISVERDPRNSLAGYTRCGYLAWDEGGADLWPWADEDAALAELVARARAGELTLEVSADAWVHASGEAESPGMVSCPADAGLPACVADVPCLGQGAACTPRSAALDEAARMKAIDKAGYAPSSSPRFAGLSEDGLPAWSGTAWSGIAVCPDDGTDDGDGDGVPDLHDNPDDDRWDVAALRVGAAGGGFVGELVTCGAGEDALSALRAFMGSRSHCLALFGLDDACEPVAFERSFGFGYALQTGEGPGSADPAPLDEPRPWWFVMHAESDRW